MKDNVGGFAVKNNSVILLLPTVENNWRHYIHEIGHTLGLDHPFNNGQYRQTSTTNFMDYSPIQNLFWHWQWKEINKTDFK
jgi:hypothetical protein